MPALDYTRLADLYDAYATFEADLPFWRSATRDSPGPVLELMAGTGRVTLPLLRQGTRLVATDLVPAMLAELRRKLAGEGLQAPVICSDVRRSSFPAVFPLVILPFQGFSEITSEKDQRRTLAAVRRTLSPGGRFLCTLHNPASRTATLDGTWQEACRVLRPDGSGSLVVSIRALHDPKNHLVTGTQRIDQLDAAGRCRRRSLPLRFSLLPAERFRGMAADAGFAVGALYGDYQMAPYREESSPCMIWVLEARESSSAG